MEFAGGGVDDDDAVVGVLGQEQDAGSGVFASGAVGAEFAVVTVPALPVRARSPVPAGRSSLVTSSSSIVVPAMS